MLKPDVSNILKFSEDSLYKALDYFQDDHCIVMLVEARLDQLANDKTKQQEFKVAEAAKRQLTIAQIKELRAIISGKQMVTFVNKLRDEYEGDYEICQSTFTVYSNVARPDQNSSWECRSLEAAEFRVVELIYDRIYFKYMYKAAQYELERFYSMMLECA